MFLRKKDWNLKENQHRAKVKQFFITCMVVLLAISSSAVKGPESFAGQTGTNPKLRIVFLNVGQGDSVYIDYGEFDALIDGGPNDKGSYVVNYLEKQGVKDLDLVVATHPHADHIGGIDDVLRKFKVLQIVDSGAKPASASSANTNYQKALKEEIAQKATYTPDKNMKITSGDLTLEVVEAGDGFEELNDESVIVKVTLGTFSALFTGDAEANVEKILLSKFGKTDWLNVDLFKAAHHGSRTSNTLEFLKATSPAYVVISSGKDNDYGHPHAEALSSYSSVKAKVYNTAESGVVTVETDGKTISVGGKETPVVATPSVKGLFIESVDLKGETVTVANGSKIDVNLLGYYILSSEGNQKYVFPNYVLKAGGKVTVYSKGGKGQLKWSDQNIWNNSGDKAVLYGPDGERISEK